MKIWGQKAYDSDVKVESNYQVVGHHRELSDGGVISCHKYEWHATYNSMLINSDGGMSRTEKIKK